MKYLIGFISLVFTVSTWATTPKNAAEFLTTISAEGGSGGAGNGGNNLISEFYRDGLSGLAYLKLTREVPEADLIAVHEATKRSKVYPVEFQLCPMDHDSNCSNDVAFASKNYPTLGIILLDARDLPGRYRQMTTSQKRRHALHEFAGLAGLELSNHHLSAHIDAEGLYSSFKTKAEKREYFAFLGSYFNSLPTGKFEDYIGSWIKRSSFLPTQQISTDPKNVMPKGMRLYLKVSESLNQRDDSVLFIRSLNFLYNNGDALWQVQEGIEWAPVSDEGLSIESRAYTNAAKRIMRRKGKRFKELLTPVERTESSPIPEFKCKPANENQLICRQFHWAWAAYNFVSRAYWVSEYVIYDRTTLKPADLSFRGGRKVRNTTFED